MNMKKGKVFLNFIAVILFFASIALTVYYEMNKDEYLKTTRVEVEYYDEELEENNSSITTSTTKEERI